MGTEDLIHCEVCNEWTHPRANGDQVCPKHTKPEKPKVIPFKRKKTGDDL